MLKPAAGQERSFAYRSVWWMVNAYVLGNRLIPFTMPRTLALKTFGAKVGRGVVLRPGMKVKFPWKLRIGDGAAIGEDAWLDNIAPIEIGDHAVVSQGAYLCTGNHDWKKPDAPLTAKPIVVEDNAWIGAQAVIGPGVVGGRNALVRLGSVVVRDVPPKDDASRGR